MQRRTSRALSPRKTETCSAPRENAHLRSWAWGAALVVLVGVAYAPVWHAQLLGYDDNDYVVHNPTLRGLGGLWEMWTRPLSLPQWYPVAHSVYWVEYQLWGLRPLGFHLVNVACHAAAAVLLWRVLLQLAVPGAWFAAALFALHPVCVESVAWVSELKNVLSLALGLGAMGCYLRFWPPEEPSPAPVSLRQWVNYGLALLLFALALLSKSVVAPLPAVLLVIHWWKRGDLSWQTVRPLVPFFALSVATGLLTIWLEKHHVGAEGEDWTLSIAERWLVAGRAIWFYVGKLVWPSPLMFIYPRFVIDSGAAWQYLFPLGVLVAFAALWTLRGRIGRGPLAAVLIFCGLLVPALGFVDVWPFRYSFVADHYQYHACVALVTLVASVATLAARRYLPENLSIFAAGGVLLLLGMLTFRQAELYENLGTLSADNVAKNPDSWVAHLNLGVYLESDGKGAEALSEYREAVRLNPRAPDAHGALGFMLLQAGQPEEALEQFQAALAIMPEFARAIYGKGVLLLNEGKLDEAQKHFEHVIERRWDHADARQALATVLASKGQLDQARDQLLKALAIDPSFPEAHLLLGRILAQQGDLPGAQRHLEQVLEADGGQLDALNGLAQIGLELKQYDQAAAYARRVLKVRPDDAGADATLKAALERRRSAAP